MLFAFVLSASFLLAPVALAASYQHRTSKATGKSTAIVNEHDTLFRDRNATEVVELIKNLRSRHPTMVSLLKDVGGKRVLISLHSFKAWDKYKAYEVEPSLFTSRLFLDISDIGMASVLGDAPKHTGQFSDGYPEVIANRDKAVVSIPIEKVHHAVYSGEYGTPTTASILKNLDEISAKIQSKPLRMRSIIPKEKDPGYRDRNATEVVELIKNLRWRHPEAVAAFEGAGGGSAIIAKHTIKAWDRNNRYAREPSRITNRLFLEISDVGMPSIFGEAPTYTAIIDDEGYPEVIPNRGGELVEIPLEKLHQALYSGVYGTPTTATIGAAIERAKEKRFKP